MDQFPYIVIFTVLSFISGFILHWWTQRGQATSLQELQIQVNELSEQLAGAREEYSALREQNIRLDTELKITSARVIEFRDERDQLKNQKDDIQNSSKNISIQLAQAHSKILADEKQFQEKLNLLLSAKEELANQFKILANEIFEDKSKRFAEQNRNNLEPLLGPLQKQITDFRSKVEEVYLHESKERSDLSGQVKILMTLNQQMSAEANNLTLALKGDRKAQGNYGEIILDDVLELAGLIPEQHYSRQASVKSEDGLSHLIPDVVIRLPGERCLVVDAKFTLPDYQAYSGAQSEIDRTAALKRHLLAIRNHILGLSKKNYQSLLNNKSPDFVVMFIPLEPAFMIAVTNDSELFQFAWERNVLLVSPSTLLFVVRTVAYLWRQEDLSQNAKEISKRGAMLYEKIAGFVEDLQKIGERLRQAQDSYDGARRKLSEGSGNVLQQAKQLKELGVHPNKQLPDLLS